jgi:RNA polymerase sigma factor (sigma-70 family)
VPPNKREQLAEAVSKHFLEGGDEFPYDSLKGILIHYLDRTWKGAFDSDDVADILGNYWELGCRIHSPDKGNPVNLMFRVAHHFMANKLKRKRRRSNVVYNGDARPEWHANAADDQRLDDKIDAPSKQELRDGIDQLFRKRAHLLRLRYLSGLSDGQIARLMGMSKGAVSSKLSFAKSQLSTVLANKIAERP